MKNKFFKPSRLLFASALMLSAVTVAVRAGDISDVTSAMHEAIKNNDPEGVRAAIASGADVNRPSAVSSTISHWPDIDYFSGKTPLLMALSSKGDHAGEMVSCLLQSGANPNSHIGDIFPLKLAVQHNNHPVVMALLAHGANVDQRDGYGMTSLRALLYSLTPYSDQCVIFHALNEHGASPFELWFKDTFVDSVNQKVNGWRWVQDREGEEIFKKMVNDAAAKEYIPALQMMHAIRNCSKNYQKDDPEFRKLTALRVFFDVFLEDKTEDNFNGKKNSQFVVYKSFVEREVKKAQSKKHYSALNGIPPVIVNLHAARYKPVMGEMMKRNKMLKSLDKHNRKVELKELCHPIDRCIIS